VSQLAVTAYDNSMIQKIRNMLRQSRSREYLYRLLKFCDTVPPYSWIYSSRIESRSKIIPQFPLELSIETINLCNAHCTICAHPDMKRAKGKMATELATSLIDQAAGRVKKLYLSGFGEPLVDTRLPEFVAQARDKGIPTISVVTNALLLKPEMAANLIDAGLNEINISMDGFTAESYAQTRLGLKYEQVVDNIKELHAVIESRPSSKKDVKVLISAVDLLTNRHERGIAVELLGKYVDHIYFRQAQGWTANYGHFIAGYSPHFKSNRIPCRYLWDSMSVYIDGRVPPCCLDYEAEQSMGDATCVPLSEIWQGERFANYRQMHLENRKSELCPCGRCGYYSVWW
jgi:MoaA/NifB/PqqE/SkfB family radical SAM enzyme